MLTNEISPKMRNSSVLEGVEPACMSIPPCYATTRALHKRIHSPYSYYYCIILITIQTYSYYHSELRLLRILVG